MVLRSAVDSAQRALGLFDFADTVVETGSLREGEDTNTEDNGPQPAEADDDAPGSGAVLLVRDGAVVEARSEENTFESVSRAINYNRRK